MRITQVVAVVVATFGLASGSIEAEAGVPQTMNYQGVLKNTAGAPMPGSHSMTFRLYNDSAGGTKQWEETQTVTVDSAGLFNVILGVVAPIPDSAIRAQAWLGTTVGADPELAPRQRLTSVAYSMRSAYADSSGSSGLWSESGGDIFRPAGNVGIGTTTPARALHVVGEGIVLDRGGMDVALFGASDTIEHNHYLNLVNATGRMSAWGLRAGGLLVADNFGYGSPGKNDLIVKGNVGIGTANPSQKLSVNGLLALETAPWIRPSTRGLFLFHDGFQGGYIYAHDYPSDQPDPIGLSGKDVSLNTQVGSGAVSRLFIQNDGNVGIGTISPDQKLGVSGMIGVYPTPWVSPTTRGIFMHHGGTAGYIWAYNYPAGEGDPVSVGGKDISFHTYSGGGTFLRLFVQNDGNVGIGTTTPIYKLHTEGSSYSTEHFTGGVNVGNGSSYSLSKGDEFRFQTSYGYAPGPVKIAVRGNFANDALDTQDALSLSFSRQEGVDYDYGYPYVFDINQFGSTKLRLDKFGNVGIGTTSPAAKLDVAGAVNAATYYGDGSHLTGIAGTTDNDWTINGNDVYHALGNVGIGTSAPAAKLHVEGAAVVNGPGGSVNALTANTSGTYSSVAGLNSGGGPGIYAESYSTQSTVGAITARARADGGSGVYSETWSAGAPFPGTSVAVYGWAAHQGATSGGGCIGVMGKTDAYRGIGQEVPMGVYGEAMHTTGVCWGVAGETRSTNVDAVGVKGTLLAANAQGKAILGVAPTTGYAGYFQGNVHVNGTLSKSGGLFKIDHPLDPENKYLQHSFVESPDMMNIYSGNTVLDRQGEATIELPAYLEALNKDFRYQLTCVGGYANVYISEKIQNNRFRIAGGTSGLEVSWQVTGVRQDAWANAHRIVPEIEKETETRGKYLHPVELGKSEAGGIDYSPARK